MSKFFKRTLTYSIALAALAFHTPAMAVEWTPRAPLNSYANIDPEIPDSRVDVATDKQNTALSIWFQNASFDGDYSKVYLSRSSDAGQNWGAPVLLYQQTSREHVLVAPSTVHLGSGHWLAAWVLAGTRIHETILMVSHSADGGQTWSSPESASHIQLILTRPTNTRLSLATDTSGTVIASFQSQIFRSGDNGHTWTHFHTPATTTTPSVYYNPVVEQDVTSRIAYFGNGKWLNIFLRKGAAGLDYNWQLFYQSVSSDNGITWTAPSLMELPRNNPYYYGRTVTADLAVEGQTALLVYNDWYDLKFARSSNAGTSWAVVGSIPDAANVQSAYSNFPELSLASNNEKAVVAIDRPVNSNGTDMYVSYSPNGGDSWSALTALPGAPGFLTPTVAPMATNTFLLHYEKMTRPVGYHVVREIRADRSTDGGATWQTGLQLNAGAPGELDLHLDLLPSIAAGDGGMWVAIWHSLSMYGDGEVGHLECAISSDYGKTWGKARPLYATNASRALKPVIVYSGQGRWLVHWQKDNQTLASLSTENAVTWSVPGPVAAGPNLHVLDSNDGGTLLALSTTGYWRSDDFGETWVSAGAARYGIAAHHISGGTWIAFEDKTVSVSEDNGFNWTQVGTLEGTYPEHSISIDHSSDGTLIAVIHYRAGCNEYDCSGPITIARSTDGGASWEYSPVVTGDVQTWRYSKTAWLGGDKWITVWAYDPSLKRATYVISEDNGMSWSMPGERGDLPSTGLRSMAVADGHATIVGGSTSFANASVYFRYHSGVADVLGVSSDDVYYSNLVLAGPAAAGDWALYE